MKICLLTQTLNPKTGAGVFTNNLINGVRQIESAIEFSVLTSEDCLKPSIYEVLKNWQNIRSKIKEADLVHALDGYPYGVVAYLANVGIAKPVIITLVGSGSIRKLVGFGWKSLLLRWAYKRSTKVTAISRYVASEVKKVWPNLTVEVINHGVDYDFYANTNGEPTREYDYIISTGEFKRRKGYSEILPIVKKAMDAHPDLRYMIIADASRNQPYRDELYELINKIGIKDKVIIKSGLSQEELRDAYRNAKLYLTLPKNVDGDVEGFGLAIMEAAAAGTPAIVGRGSGADDAIADGQSGFLVDGKNEKEVVEKILSIIDNKELHEKLSNGAKKWARENIWESKIKQYINLYEKI